MMKKMKKKKKDEGKRQERAVGIYWVGAGEFFFIFLFFKLSEM